MKILHIITSLGPGGAEGMLYRLIKSTSNSIEHSVICLNKGGKYVSLMRDLNVDVLVLSDEIEEVFDHLGSHDVVMSENRPYNAKVVYFSHDDQVGPGIPGEELEHYNPEHIKLYKEIITKIQKILKMRKVSQLFK